MTDAELYKEYLKADAIRARSITVAWQRYRDEATGEAKTAATDRATQWDSYAVEADTVAVNYNE